MSTSAVNPAISNLLGTITSQFPALATPAVQSALASAPAQDIVALSEAALQAQDASGLFGQGDSSGNSGLTPAFDPANLLSNLVQTAEAPTPGTQASGTQAAPVANLLAALLYQQASALLSGGSTTSVQG